MRLSLLDRLYEQPGPWAAVYLDTSRDVADPERATALRWRHLRDDLVAGGADEATVEALADVVGADRAVAGRHGQALFAARGRLVLAGELPEPPPRDVARFGRLPHALPLAVQCAPDIPYAVVALELLAGGETEGPAEVVAAVENGRWPLSRVLPGPCEVHRVPAGAWRRAAPDLARQVEELAGRGDAEVVVVSAGAGAEEARGVLVNRLPRRVRETLVTVPGAAVAEEGRALLETGLLGLLAGRLNADDHRRLHRYGAQRDRRPRASEGLPAVVSALQRGLAEAVFVTAPPRIAARLWAGAEPPQIALTEEELRAFRAVDVREEAGEDALLWSVMGTGAELVVVPEELLSVPDGVGVLLRE
ncbi:hypothetical protein [Streptomyces caatingaensis]|uniref:Peptide chain release factor 1 n=1 Tax=Streptomyces caatingaensis TaxID=1678637 RepID=A0A0K9XFN5_9ACTN|nr:hypothetical protein [Streptomyces caatingaensis]KNB52219.1 hypothetical protein AC230_11730 [Streptomyces caatingaensis]